MKRTMPATQKTLRGNNMVLKFVTKRITGGIVGIIGSCWSGWLLVAGLSWLWFFKRHVSVGHAVPWFGVAIPREYFLAITKLFVQMLCDTKPRCRTFSPVSHGAQYLTVLVSHSSSISRTQYLSQYLTTVSHDTPVSHASISRFQDLSFSLKYLSFFQIPKYLKRPGSQLAWPGSHAEWRPGPWHRPVF